MLLASLFSGFGAQLMGLKAAANAEGLILGDIVTLPAEAAIAFYWRVVAVAAAFVVAGLVGALAGLQSSHRLRLASTEIPAPRFIFSREVTVARLEDIVRIEIRTVKRERFLHIHHGRGKLTNMQSSLPDAGALDVVHEALVARADRRRVAGLSIAAPS